MNEKRRIFSTTVIVSCLLVAVIALGACDGDAPTECPPSNCSKRIGVAGGTTYTLSVGLLGGPNPSQAFVLEVEYE